MWEHHLFPHVARKGPYRLFRNRGTRMCPCIAQLAKVSGQPILPQSSLPTFVLAAVWTCSGCSPMFVYMFTGITPGGVRLELVQQSGPSLAVAHLELAEGDISFVLAAAPNQKARMAFCKK